MMSSNYRKDIHILSRNSNLNENAANDLLQKKVYQQGHSWLKFLKTLLLVLGYGFSIAGVVFFFAYNWDAMPKFVKLGVLQALVVGCIVSALLANKKPLVRNIALSVGALLTGVLFAVFGQIYQTGANAYDFFLNWTIAVTFWVVVSRFPPLWLIYLTLINTTLVLYQEQVSNQLSETGLFNLLFLLNSLAAFVTLWWPLHKKTTAIPVWFSNLIILVAFYCATLAVIAGIFEDFEKMFVVTIASTLILYALTFRFSYTHKKLFPLAIGGLSVIIIISASMLKISKDPYVILLSGLLILGGVSLLIYHLIQLQKRWSNEQVS